MEGITQEDDATEVIVLDDSFDGDIFANETPTCTRKTSEAESVESAELETASGITQESLAKDAMTVSGQVKTVGFKGRVIHVYADLPVLSVEACSGRDTASEYVEGVPDADRVEDQKLDNPDLTTERVEDQQQLDNPDLTRERVEDQQLDNLNLTKERVEDLQQLDNPDLTTERVEDQQLDNPHLTTERVKDLQQLDNPHLTTERVKDQQLDNPHLTTERGQSAIGESSNTGCTSTDACSEFSKADSNAGKEETRTDAGKEETHTNTEKEETHSNTEKDETHSNTEKDETHTNTEKEETHSNTEKEETHSNTEKEETHSNTEKEETHSNTENEETHTNTENDETHSCTENDETHTNAGKEEVHTDAGKEDPHPLLSETSLHIETVTSSLDSKSVAKSSDGMPVKFTLDNESRDLQNDGLVTPVSSKELSTREIPPEVPVRQLKLASTGTANFTSDKESSQSTRYIIIQNKNTATKQEAARKPGDKLTSLLQRLTSGKSGKVALKLSTTTKPLSSQDTQIQAEVSQSSLAGSPSVSVLSPTVFVGLPATFMGSPAVSIGSSAVSVLSPAVSVQSPAVSIGSSAVAVGSSAVSVLSPAVSVQSPAVAVGSPAVAVGSSAVAVGSPAVAVGSPAVAVGSPAMSVGSMQDKPAVSPHFVKEVSSRTSRKITVKFPPVSQENFPMSNLPTQTDSSTKTHQSQVPFKAKTSKTISFEKVTIPATMSLGKDPVQSFPQAQYGKQAKKSNSVIASLLETKPAEVPIQLGSKVFKVFSTSRKQSPNSPATPGFPALLPADKIKYVLGYLPVQGSRASNIIFTAPKGQNIILGKPGDTYLQPAGVQSTTQKSKYSFSLLQNPASKLPEAVQVNVSPQGKVMKRSPTVRSLLTSSSTPSAILKSPQLSTSETGNANASNSLPNVTATVSLKDTVTPSTFSDTQKNKRAQTHTRQYHLADSGQTKTKQYKLADSGQLKTRQYQLTNSAQIVLQALSQQAAVTTSSDFISSGITTVPLSKLAATTPTSKLPISKSCIVSSSASSTTSGRPIVVMPTALLSTPVPTILTPASSISSKSRLAPGIMTYSNLAANPSQSGVLNTVFVPKTLEGNPAIQPPATTAHSFSDLIARIALKSVPSTSASKPSGNIKSSMQALNLALLQLNEDLGDSAAPVRIIVSQSSGVKSAAKLVYTQAQPSAVSQCGTITTQAGKKITVSKTSRSTTVTDGSGKQIPILIYPKPVSTDGVIRAPVKAKGVSLLPMSLVAKHQTTSEGLEMARKSLVKRRDEQIVEVSDLKEAFTNSSSQKSKKVKVSASAGAPKKPKNVVYAAILRTGQGPVSVKVVAPDMDDDSSDTMSDAGWSNVMFSEESVLASEDTRGKASDVDSSPSNKLFESDMPDLLCTEEVIHSDQEPHDSCHDVVLTTELPHMGSSIEPVVSHHYVHEVSDEETDTDTEVTSMEEQDMSVLRQLLINTATNSSCDSETTPKFHQFSTSSDLMVLSNAGNQTSNAGNQPGNSLSSDHEGLTLLTSNSENDNWMNQVVTEENIDVKSCDLKIESVFSLRDPGDYIDTELPADVEVCQELPDDQTEPLPTFNVRTSDDWKSFLNPCYVVLERLSKSKLLVERSTKTTSKCSGHCRKRTLDYLCNLNLLRCVNHPDPFLFSKPKPRRIPIKKTMKKRIKHGVINEMCAPEDMSNSSQRVQDCYVQGTASEASVVTKAVELTKVMSEFSPVVKKIWVKEDVSKSPSLMKEIFKTNVGKSLSGVKKIYVNKGGQTHSLVNETYIKENIGKSPSLGKEICVKTDFGTSLSVVKQIFVKKDREIYLKEVGKSPSMLKAARARKTMKKPVPVVKFSFVKEPLSKLTPMTGETCVKASARELLVKDACVKATVSEPQMKEACVKETVTRSSPVANELYGENDINQFSQKLQEDFVQNATIKPSLVIQETCINEDVVKPLPDCSLSLPSLNHELPHKTPDKALISDSVQLSVASSSDQTEHTPTGHDDQKANDKTTDLDSICSGPKPLKFNRALKQLQRQVNKKRVTMLTEKLSRKTVKKPQTKQNERKCKIKLARQKQTNKVAVKRLRRKILKRNVHLTTDTVNTFAKSKSRYKLARGDAAGRLIHSLPSLDCDITQDSSPENIVPENKDVCSTDTPGMKPVSDPIITQLSNAQHRNTKTNLVRLQPKMPGIPQEKIQSALQSLNSYLAATGRKPTTGNTQLILLKIDDQHVLVKWPAPPAPTTPQSNFTMPVADITPETSSASNNTQSSGNMDMKKPKQNNSVSTTVTDSSFNECNPINTVTDSSFTACNPINTVTDSSFTECNPINTVTDSSFTACNPIKSLASTSTVDRTTAADSRYTACNPIKSLANTCTVTTITAHGNGTFTVTNPTSNNTTIITNIVKPNSEPSVLVSDNSKSAVGIGKKGFRMIRTKQVVGKTPRSGKSPPFYASVQASSCTQQPVSNVIINTSATGMPNITNSTLNPGLNKQTFISLLKSGVLTQSHSRSLTAFVNSARATSPIVTSPIVTSVVSSVVSHSCSKAGSTDIGSSKKASSKDTNITLSCLPPNSLLLPGRKRPNSVLSEEERRAKRRRLEEKYPLPPGIVIKSEPDDLQDYLTSVLPGISSRSDISPAFTANSSLIPTGHSESDEPFIMSSDDQVWSVENSVNIGSYFTDTEHPVQESTRGPAVHGIPTNSAIEYNLSSESCLNTEDSSDGQEQPPALLDETIEDVDDDVHLEDIPDSQEDVPPVLQPMFTSSCTSLVQDNDIEELESTEFIPEMSADFSTFVSYNRPIVRAGEASTSADSVSTTSLYSEGSMDSGVDTNFPSTSFSHTSLHGPVVDRPASKNMKIQYLKDLLKKKEMEIENMKRVQSELSPIDFDI